MADKRRYDELRAILEERRQELSSGLRSRFQEISAASSPDGRGGQVRDDGEASELGMQWDVESALDRMNARTLNQVIDALARLDHGDYGNCSECGEEIEEKRLRALPFAGRCRICEEAYEDAERRERELASRRNASSLFLDL